MSDTRRYIKPEERNEALELYNDSGKQTAVDYLTKIGIPNPEKCLKNLLARFKDTAPAATVKVDGPIRIQTKKPENVEVVSEQKPLKKGLRGLNNSDFEVSAIKHPILGEFYYDQKFGMVDWRTPEGEEVSLSPKNWKELYLIIPDVMGILGVPDDE